MYFWCGEFSALVPWAASCLSGSNMDKGNIEMCFPLSAEENILGQELGGAGEKEAV